MIRLKGYYKIIQEGGKEYTKCNTVCFLKHLGEEASNIIKSLMEGFQGEIIMLTLTLAEMICEYCEGRGVQSVG